MPRLKPCAGSPMFGASSGRSVRSVTPLPTRLIFLRRHPASLLSTKASSQPPHSGSPAVADGVLGTAQLDEARDALLHRLEGGTARPRHRFGHVHGYSGL